MADTEFQKAFAGLVQAAYSDLFDLRGTDAWEMSKTELTAYFRTTDKTSEAIGARQASVFIMFRGLSGHEQPSETPSPKQAKTPKAKAQPSKSKSAPEAPAVVLNGASSGKKDMALTVRIEINLPANGTQETYDNIFKSIRANLIND